MKLIIIRHGDPDYENDTLTERGWREAEALSERIAGIKKATFFVSPLGRARDTASLTLEKAGVGATTLPWLTEFSHPAPKPEGRGNAGIPWNWYPRDWAGREEFYDRRKWAEEPEMVKGDIARHARGVGEGLDDVLSRHGYRREGSLYRVEKANRENLVFFCHFGVECVMLSHLMNCSPMVLWHSFCALPSSVTTVVSEERERGWAIWRSVSLGDVSHLYAAAIAPSPAGMFPETYEEDDTPSS